MASYVQVNIIYICYSTFGVYTPYTDHSVQKQRHFQPLFISGKLPPSRPGKHVSIPELLKVDV